MRVDRGNIIHGSDVCDPRLFSGEIEDRRGKISPKKGLVESSNGPTQKGPDGIRYDFHFGARVLVPKDGRVWRVEIMDAASRVVVGSRVVEADSDDRLVKSATRYVLEYRIRVFVKEEGKFDTLVFEETMDLKGKLVIVQLPIGAVGDTLAWVPGVVRFGERFGCKLVCSLMLEMLPLFYGSYPDIEFLPEKGLIEPRGNAGVAVVDVAYAMFQVGVFYEDPNYSSSPHNFRYAGLHDIACDILGVERGGLKPVLSLPDEYAGRPIEEKYVCIAVQASSFFKGWLNPGGWRKVVADLKLRGYRVICIDKERETSAGGYSLQIPWGCEDFTGDRPMLERAQFLRHAEFMIGNSSGLSWLGWTAGCPVVLISGFTLPINEFENPYRVITPYACHGCWHDPKNRFDKAEFDWCPEHRGTPRQYECSKLITPELVLRAVNRIPGVLPQVEYPLSSVLVEGQ